MRKPKPRRQGPFIHPWPIRDKKPQPMRDADFWQPTGNDQEIECKLCVWACRLQPGENGRCGYRGNVAGKMKLQAYAQVGALYPWILGYGVGSLCWYPGIRAVGLGQLHCSAACSFCYVSSFSTHPERMRENRHFNNNDGWYAEKLLYHPMDVIETAKRWNCLAVAFSYNEPVSVSWEYTRDVCRLAHHNGVKTALFTNGYASEAATRKIAPYASMVKIGVKGSGDPEFYRRYMRSDGAMDAVYKSMRVWKECGVRVTVSDTIAAPHLQTDERIEDAQKRLYSWVAENLGPLTVFHYGEMHKFNGNLVSNEQLTSSRMNDAKQHYDERMCRTEEIARECGLHYIEDDNSDREVYCHACGGILVRHQETAYDGECTYYLPHEQYTTNGHCDHCNAAVPVATLPADVLEQQIQYSIDNPAFNPSSRIVREIPQLGWGGAFASIFGGMPRIGG